MTFSMADTFYTLEAPSAGTYREKMSKFLSFALPVSTVEEAKALIERYQKKYFDARHVCWAYMIGTERTLFQSNDNGEPSGTAGKPILGQINSFNLTNLLIVVVRYFGGIKLGTSGLIAAYRAAAKEAIIAGRIIECHQMASLEINFPYVSMNQVMKTVKSLGAKILSQQTGNACSMTMTIRADFSEDLARRLEGIAGVSIL